MRLKKYISLFLLIAVVFIYGFMVYTDNTNTIDTTSNIEVVYGYF